MRIGILFFIVFLIPVCLTAQFDAPENTAWAFGKGAGMRFNGNVVTPVVTSQNGGVGAVSNAIEANASVADNNGDLLFYSNGTTVWDRSHNLMPGSVSGLHGQGVLQDQWTGSTTQGALIIPMPDSAAKYYLFSLTSLDSPYDPYRVGRLYYSVIDMSLNNGMGDIVPGRKWIVLDSLLSEKMIGIRGDCNNVWLLVHARDTNAFRAYEITRAGLAATPVYSYVGTFGNDPFQTNGIIQNVYHSVGEMKVSPDRKKLVACWSLGGNFAALYDFDVQTGRVANELKLHSGVPFYGAAFSPDNSKVYVANGQTIWQYDMAAANIPATRIVVGAVARNAASGMRLAPDGKIYLRINNPQNQIGAIQYPNLAGAACSLVVHQLTVPGTGTGNLTFPNEVPVPAYPNGVAVTVHKDSISCDQPEIRLQASAGSSSYVWHDGVTGSRRSVNMPGVYWVQGRFQCALHVDTFFVHENADGYNIETTIHTDSFSCREPGLMLQGQEGYTAYLWDDGSGNNDRFVTAPGVYWVRVQNFCERYVDTFIIKEIQDLAAGLGADTIICDGHSFVLEAGYYPGAVYLWQDGSAGRQFEVSRSGAYHVQVVDGRCIAADTVAVWMAEVTQDLGPDRTICRDEPVAVTLQARTTAANEANVLWSTGERSATVLLQDTGIFWVTVSEGQCSGTDTIRVSGEICSCKLLIPDAFTPNGDGLNDLFRASVQRDCPVSSYQIRIYDRWGKMVFSGTDPFTGWDGLIRGSPADGGVYMYEVSLSGGTRRTPYYHKGDVTLIR